MAKGFLTVARVFNEGDFSPLAPAGSSLDVGSNERVYVYSLTMTVLTPGVGFVSVEDGATGQVLARMDTSVPYNSLQRNYATNNRTYPSRALGVGNSLMVMCQGGSVEVEAVVEVR